MTPLVYLSSRHQTRMKTAQAMTITHIGTRQLQAPIQECCAPQHKASARHLQDSHAPSQVLQQLQPLPELRTAQRTQGAMRQGQGLQLGPSLQAQLRVQARQG